MLGSREQLILLNLVPGLSARAVRRLLDALGGVAAVAEAGPEALQQATGVSALAARRIADGLRDEARLARELALARQHGASVVTLEDPEYPAPLKAILDPPPALYLKG